MKKKIKQTIDITPSIKATDDKLKGEYSNVMQILHTKEGEFILDFLFVAEPTGTLVSRVIISKEHLERMIPALIANLKKYKKNYENI